MGGRQTKRQRRRETIAAAEEILDDEEFGIRVEMKRGDRLVLTFQPAREAEHALMGLNRFRILLADLEREWVLVAREDGASWEEIGWLLGITGEAARRRHGQADRMVQDAPEGIS